jgi:hypothetical protein
MTCTAPSYVNNMLSCVRIRRNIPKRRELSQRHRVSRDLQHQLLARLEPNASLPQANLKLGNLPSLQFLAVRELVLWPMLCRQLMVECAIAGAECSRRAKADHRVDWLDFGHAHPFAIAFRDVHVLQDNAVGVCFAHLHVYVHVVLLVCRHVEDCSGGAEEGAGLRESVGEAQLVCVLVHLLSDSVCLVGEGRFVSARLVRHLLVSSEIESLLFGFLGRPLGERSIDYGVLPSGRVSQ